MRLDNLNPIAGNSDPKRAAKIVAHALFGGRLRWNDGDEGAWKESLSEDVRNHPSTAKFKTPEDALKSYIELEKTLGKDRITIPGENAPVEEVATFFSKLGRPEKADDYKLATEIEGVPKDMAMNQDLIKAFREVAHTTGLNQKQVAGLYEWFVKGQAGEIADMAEAKTTAMEKVETALRTKMGKSYEPNVALAKKVIENFGGKDAKAFLDEGLGNNPVLIEMLAGVGKHLSEDVLGDGAGSRLTQSPQQAQSELSTIMNDPKNAYFDKGHPEHQATVEKVTQLTEQVHPEKAEGDE